MMLEKGVRLPQVTPQTFPLTERWYTPLTELTYVIQAPCHLVETLRPISKQGLYLNVLSNVHRKP
jgi:hypothetical protein